MEGAGVYAERIIEILARNGNIKFSRTHLYANDSINMFSDLGTRMEFWNGISETKKTKITANNAGWIAKNGAGIRQNDDGSISFYA